MVSSRKSSIRFTCYLFNLEWWISAITRFDYLLRQQVSDLLTSQLTTDLSRIIKNQDSHIRIKIWTVPSPNKLSYSYANSEPVKGECNYRYEHYLEQFLKEWFPHDLSRNTGWINFLTGFLERSSLNLIILRVIKMLILYSSDVKYPRGWDKDFSTEVPTFRIMCGDSSE